MKKKGNMQVLGQVDMGSTIQMFLEIPQEPPISHSHTSHATLASALDEI